MAYAQHITSEEIEKMEFATFSGQIQVIDKADGKFHEAIRYLSHQPMIGFDTETKPCFVPKVPRNKMAILQLSGEDRVADVWAVAGVSFEEEDKLWQRRVWLYGRSSGRMALLLDFSHKSRVFEHSFSAGDHVRATLAFYPGTFPLRAVVAEGPVSVPGEPMPSFSLDDALLLMARAVTASPWQRPLPLFFSGARLFCENDTWSLLVGDEREIALAMTDTEAWELLARSGGHPLTVCGEWDGRALRLAGAFVQTES